MLIIELAAGMMVDKMVLVGLTTTVAVDVGTMNPSSVEQNP